MSGYQRREQSRKPVLLALPSTPGMSVKTEIINGWKIKLAYIQLVSRLSQPLPAEKRRKWLRVWYSFVLLSFHA